jgi:hypothetical protein
VIKLKKMSWAGHVARIRGGEIAQGLVGEPEGIRTLGSPRRGWENNIKMDVKGT